jgi:hypothetical protein
MVPPGMFSYRFGGPSLPEYEIRSDDEVYYATVYFTLAHEAWDSETLMEFMVHQIRNGNADISLRPLHGVYPLCISIPVYGFYDAVCPLVIASALSVAERYLTEIQQGFIEIDKKRLFRKC